MGQKDQDNFKRRGSCEYRLKEVLMNNPALRRLGIIAMGSLLTVGVQIASGRAETWSSPNWRPVSGLTGDSSVFYTSSSPTHALNRLEFYEQNNDPMLINIWLEKLCHDPPCDPGQRNIELRIGTREENLGSKKIISAGDDHYITAIQVCTTNDNDQRKREIKGVRIWNARLEPGGIVNRTGKPPIQFDNPNCNNHWRAKQTCLGDRVAVGLRGYFNDDAPQFNNRFWFTGLELQCALVNED